MTDTPAPKAPRVPPITQRDITSLTGDVQHLLNLHGQHQNSLSDTHQVLLSVQDLLAGLHEKLDALTVRANEAEKLLNSPAVKLAKGAQKLWSGLG